MANEGLFYKFLLWREKRIKEKHFILIISFIVGLCTAAAAIILKQLIHFIQHLLTGNFNADGVNYLYLLYPVIGILLAGLFVKYIVRDDISHGVTKILYAISQRKSRIKPLLTQYGPHQSFHAQLGFIAPFHQTGSAVVGNKYTRWCKQRTYGTGTADFGKINTNLFDFTGIIKRRRFNLTNG